MPSPTGATHPYPAIGAAVGGGQADHRLDPRLVAAAAREVRARCDPVGPIALARRPEAAPEPAVGAVGDDDQAGANLVPASVVPAHVGPPDEPALDDRRRRLVPHQNVGARLGGCAAQRRVEDGAPHHEAARGERVVLGPRHGDRTATVRHPDALHLVPAESERIDVEIGELGERSRAQRVAARLVTVGRPLLDDGHVVAGPGEPDADGRAGGAAADDQHVGL